MLRIEGEGTSNLFEPDPEPERSFNRRRRQQRERARERRARERAMADQENKPLREYAAPNARTLRAGPVIQAENFAIPTALLNMIMQYQFGGLPSEEPNAHIDTFLEFCGTIRINGATDEAIRLRMFPYSLRDKAKLWYKTLSDETLASWQTLEKAFLNKYFPPSKTIQIRHLIQNFVQKDGESISEAWERFNDLLNSCPHHGLQKWLIVHTFYTGLNFVAKQALDSAADGAFMNKAVVDAYGIIETVASNYHQWANERAVHSKVTNDGRLEDNGVSLIMNKLDSMTRRLDRVEKDKFHSMNVVETFCDDCGEKGHTWKECRKNAEDQVAEQTETCNNIYDYNQQERSNYRDRSGERYPAYRKNNPNMSWRNNNVLNPPFQEGGAGRPEPRFPQVSNSSVESMLKNLAETQKGFMESQTKTNAIIQNALNEISAKVESLTIHGKMLETQISQQAGNASRQQGRFPGQPDVNPIKEQVNAIFVGDNEDFEIESDLEIEHKVEEHDLALHFEKIGLKSMPDRVLPSSKANEDSNDCTLKEKYHAELIRNSPPKLEDPGSFIIPCTIGIFNIEKALCDLGASINMMPLSIYEKLGIGDLKPVNYSVQFASGGVLSPKGIIEDIPVKVRGSIVPADFVVVEMEQDSRVQVFLGRPFLATAGALIDVKNSKITFNIGDNNISFVFDQTDPCLNDLKSSEQVTIPEELSEIEEHGTGQHERKDEEKEKVTAEALFLHKKEESSPLKKKKVERRSSRGPYYWSNKLKERKKKVVFKESYLDTSIDEVMMDRRHDIAQGRIQAEDCDPG